MNITLSRTIFAGLLTLWLASCGGGADVPATTEQGGATSSPVTRTTEQSAATPATRSVGVPLASGLHGGATSYPVTRSTEQSAATPEDRSVGVALASGFHKPLRTPWPSRQIPSNLWQPPAGATPASGSYVYLESEEGDVVGEGRSYLYTPANAVLLAWQGTWQPGRGRYLGVSVLGEDGWSGDFQTMSSLDMLRVGYYPRVGRFPLHGTSFAGQGWSKGSRQCESANGWVAIDAVEAPLIGLLTRIEMRFEQVCSNSSARLRGKVVWHVADAGLSGDRMATIPAGVWRAPAAAGIPEEGMYAYLESDPGHYVGQGRKRLFMLGASGIMVSDSPRGLSIGLWGADGSNWQGALRGRYRTDVTEPLTTGIYPVRRVGSGFINDPEGDISWISDGRSCSSSGWFVIDHIVYVGQTIREVDARFEDFCDGYGESLRGQFRWRR
jgi:hypothetical protein